MDYIEKKKDKMTNKKGRGGISTNKRCGLQTE